jgi:hypothetical protein
MFMATRVRDVYVDRVITTAPGYILRRASPSTITRAGNGNISVATREFLAMEPLTIVANRHQK